MATDTLTKCQLVGKIAYPSKQAAFVTVTHMTGRKKCDRQKKNPGPTKVYKCDACKLWHVGRDGTRRWVAGVKSKAQARAEAQTSDFGTPELAKRHHTTIEQPDPNDQQTKRIRVEQCQVQWYLRRHYLTQPQADALTKWQSLAYLSGLQPSCTGSLEPRVAGSMSDMSDTRLSAKISRDSAVTYLSKINPILTLMVDAVAVNGNSAGRWLLARTGEPPNRALELLQFAASSLAKHWGMVR